MDFLKKAADSVKGDSSKKDDKKSGDGNDYVDKGMFIVPDSVSHTACSSA